MNRTLFMFNIEIVRVIYFTNIEKYENQKGKTRSFSRRYCRHENFTREKDNRRYKIFTLYCTF